MLHVEMYYPPANVRGYYVLECNHCIRMEPVCTYVLYASVCIRMLLVCIGMSLYTYSYVLGCIRMSLYT